MSRRKSNLLSNIDRSMNGPAARARALLRHISRCRLALLSAQLTGEDIEDRASELRYWEMKLTAYDKKRYFDRFRPMRDAEREKARWLRRSQKGNNE